MSVGAELVGGFGLILSHEQVTPLEAFRMPIVSIVVYVFGIVTQEVNDPPFTLARY